MDDEGLAVGRFALDEIVTVSEDAIASAIRWLACEYALKVEGSGAVGVAALRAERIAIGAEPCVIVLTGGNIDEMRWSSIVSG